MHPLSLKEFEEEVAETPKRGPLTIRTIDEILAMTFDPADLILPNGYLTAGELTAMCGIGGIGKSRLAMQFGMCCRVGWDFLGWPTNGRDLRFLFLQTENSCRRLQDDLKKMLSAFTPDEQKHLNAGIFFHTLEVDDDGFLALDAENKERAENVINEKAANVVVYDPLRDFSLDDLNSDKFMGETVRDILRITKHGNPKRVPLLLHHALTGKAGAQRTTGWDRSSFGRNSKVLQMMARAVINVGQARPDDNSVILIGSGKCNNAPEFTAFAARLNFETMLYARDEDFDMQSWREEVDAKPKRFPVEMLRDLKFKEMEIEPLAKFIRDKIGCGRSRSYELVREAVKIKLWRFNKLTETYAKR